MAVKGTGPATNLQQPERAKKNSKGDTFKFDMPAPKYDGK